MSKFTSISAEQIERFFEGHCSAEEASAISRYLQEHPAAFRYYVEREWQEADKGADVNHEESRKMYREIRKQLKAATRTGKLITLRRVMAVAAAVMAVVVSVYFFRAPEQRSLVSSGQETPSPAAATSAAATPVPAVATSSPTPAIRILHSIQQERHVLPDGSSVVLYANSTLQYAEPFDTARRAITVQGKAMFSVAKDRRRPFIVTAGSIETTVLGTEFLVTETPGRIDVQLFSGKVRLRNTAQPGSKGLVLVPGEALVYAEKDGTMAISRRQQEAPEEPEATEPVMEGNLVFDNQNLSHVLDRLAASYHVKISYNKQQISNLYFTGDVLTTEPLTTTLHIIASMNDLRIIPDKKGYSIRK